MIEGNKKRIDSAIDARARYINSTSGKRSADRAANRAQAGVANEHETVGTQEEDKFEKLNKDLQEVVGH